MFTADARGDQVDQVSVIHVVLSIIGLIVNERYMVMSADYAYTMCIYILLTNLIIATVCTYSWA